MKKFACLIVACLAVALTVSEIDAGCGGGGGGGAGLFGRGGGFFARLRARRQQSNAAYESSASFSSTSSFRSSSMYAAPAAVFVPAPAPAFLPMPKAVVPTGCNCPGNVPVPDAPMAKPPEKISAAPATPTYQTVMTTRSPMSHTHTCANGHTWDHAATSSHNCPVCGLFQNVQDRSPRPVTVVKTIRVDSPQVANVLPNAVAAPAARIYQQAAPVSFISRSSSSCANGQCARH